MTQQTSLKKIPWRTAVAYWWAFSWRTTLLFAAATSLISIVVTLTMRILGHASIPMLGLCNLATYFVVAPCSGILVMRWLLGRIQSDHCDSQ